jgi:hypothetical protein
MKELDTFGKMIMEKLRDEAISFVEGLVRGHWKAPALKKLQRDIKKLDEQQVEVLRRTVRAATDAAVHSLLFALQEAGQDGTLEIRINGKNLAELTDGLQGELFTENGWQARFSDYGVAPGEA